MSDLIKRQDAIDEVINLWADKPFGNPALVEIKDCIEALPSAERKRGEWVDYKCSICGFEPYNPSGLETFNYCPNCGADMRGDTDE